MGQSCQKLECTQPAKFEVILELRTDPREKGARSTPIVFLCGDHINLGWADLVTEKGWETICEACIKQGKVAPVKQYCNLVIQDITIKPTA